MEDKHAYWIPVDCNFAGDSGVYCSNCDFFVSDYTDNMEDYNFCPKCGIIMGEPIKNQKDKTTVQISIDMLNAFTKAWCMDCKATEESEEPVFRCFDCSFRVPGSKKCRIKCFCYNQDEEYTRSVDFGCMGV